MPRMTSRMLGKAVQEGKRVLPLIRPEGQKDVYWEARNQYDPKPWTDGTYRYSAPELEIVYRDPMDYQRWLQTTAQGVADNGRSWA